MKTTSRGIAMLLIVALLLPFLPAPAEAAEQEPIIEESFAGGLANWDLFGSTAWQVQGSGADALLTGTTTATSPQRAVVKQSAFPYSTKDYSVEFKAQADRYRLMFRYTSGTSYYFLEFKNASMVELWKYPNSSASVIVGAPVDIASVAPGFNMAAWHDYKLEVAGSEFKLYIDGSLISVFADSDLSAGGAGFSLRALNASTPANLSVEHVAIKPPAAAPSTFTISHNPLSELPYNADLPLMFAVADGSAETAASVHYRYGEDGTVVEAPAQSIGGGAYSLAIPGSGKAADIRYFITAEDEGRSARYPESGENVVPIGEIVPYLNDFENDLAGSIPTGWTTGGNTRVIELPDGNQVLNLNGSSSAKLNLPMYQNADNFVIKFRAKYERTSTAVQNTWRIRYRALDDANNNAMEWATHNSKYFIMRKTTVGGNYYTANYVQSLLDEWHSYELHVSGITHRLVIDGQEVARGEDSDVLAPTKGYFQWNVVGGINLMVDDFSIEPISAPYVVDLQPAGNFAGIYAIGETAGLSAAFEAGAEAREIGLGYKVRRADGDQALVADGTKTYSLGRYEQLNDTIWFDAGLGGIGTYETSVELTIDGRPAPELTKRMRLAVVGEAAPVRELDLDNESKFGLNTHYKLNWRDDIIDGARKLGARHHRSGITWEEADRNAKDGEGDPVYDYSDVDVRMNKLAGLGFNQITVLGIDKNPYYQEGTVNTTSGLKSMGDFVYETVDRYKDIVRQWEMPNEPELFAKPYIPAEFVQIQKIAYLNMKKADPNAMLLAGDHTSSVLSVLPGELELGSYDYADAYSYHPYVYNSMPDGNLQRLMNGVKDLVNAYGGWKDYYLTEGGWPTANAGYPSVSEAVQRDYIVRAFLNYMITDQIKAYEYYNYKNDGTDDRYYDIFWGITDNDGRPKLAYAAVNQLMTTLDQARYLGTWDSGNPDVAVHVFLNDGEPIVMAWKKTDHKDNPAVKPPVSTIALPFGAAGLQLQDINGKTLSATEAGGQTQLEVSSSPLYIEGAPDSFVRLAAGQLLAAKRNEVAARLEALRTAGNSAALDADLAELAAIAASIEDAAGASGEASDWEAVIGDVYDLMTVVAGRIKQEEVASAPGYVALEALYNMAESASVPLAYMSAGSGAIATDYVEAAESANELYAEKKGEFSVMPVSTSAVYRLNRYGRIADAAYERGSYADSYAYNVLAREFAGAAAAIADSEPPKFIGVIGNVVPTQTNGEAGYPNTIRVSLVNDTSSPQDVKLGLKVPAGWEAVQSDALTETVSISALGSEERSFKIQVPERALKGRYEIEVEMEHDGFVFDTKKIQLTVEDGIDARIVPARETIEELDILTVELTGTSSYEKTGAVTVKGPDGEPLVPVESGGFSGLRKGDTLRLDFRWTYHEPKPYNVYEVDLSVEDTVNGKTIFRDAAMPLDFNLVNAVGDIVIDGKLDEWADAFPIHLRRKSQNANEFHDPANLEATAYAKWSNQGLYVAVAVMDNIHKQSENAANLWKNDSLQITLDPLGNRQSPYGSDDVEWGFALTDTGGLLVNVFSSSLPNPNGDISGQTPFAAVRDEAAKKTYYELLIPTEYVKDLRPASGGSLGFNVAVNDADFQNGRDNFIQWTKGTADSKNTSYYDSFVYVNYEQPLPEEEEEEPQGPSNPGPQPSVPLTAPPAGELVVTAEQLGSGDGGRSVVEWPSEADTIIIPANAGELLAGNTLVLAGESLSLELPADLLAALTKELTPEQLKDARITLRIDELAPSAAAGLVGKSKKLTEADIKQWGGAFELSLSLTAKDGDARELTAYEPPIAVRMKPDLLPDAKRSGIYRIDADGKLNYAGGEQGSFGFAAELHRAGTYALLTVDKTFADLGIGHWAYETVGELYAKQIIQGTGVSTFAPSRSVTRAEFAELLVKALRLTKAGDTPFADVSSDRWYAQSIAIAYQAGLVSGKSMSEFDPDGVITRQEMAAMLLKGARLLGAKAPTGQAVSFRDEADIAEWARLLVGEAAQLGLMRGRGDGMFAPKGVASRAEAAQAIYNLLF
ncbi:S-layer homology domain-containing protein [Paenibacillus agaridevorans]|uniref:S-layer homology domain-containing protein n=1 Tax=Paenibacillus agaridevorans TaxID=171404 RepID=UPI001BE4822A|nr:S-layer homology domain-containing protein [Paenibacillus agaridevorans]